MQLPETGHEPVLLDEVLQFLAPRPGQVFIDCTLGRAGHSSAIAPCLGESGLLIGIDADPRNLDYAKIRLERAPCRVRLFHANFSELEGVLPEAAGAIFDGIHA